MKLKEKVGLNVTKNQLATLYELMVKNGDQKSADKILDLYAKVSHNEFIISFAGHFSAGKSSILNYILGKDVLPKSPIPTSANIVKITSGEGVARVYFHKETTVQYEEPYDIDMIKDFCMDKDTIKQIEINTSEPILPQHTYLVDTPGIDAADDADRLMTESSLHLVDVLFYVMDYNHVQSEVNLYFLQEIQEQNIPFYIIINQIDKHNEQELSFAEFDKRVKQTFDQWNIYPETIFYSSIMDQHTKHNQLPEIKSYIFNLLNNQHTERIPFATKYIIEEHKQILHDDYEDKFIVNTSDNEADSGDSLALLEQRLSKLTSFEEDFYTHFTEEVNLTLNNAYLMPAQLRELAGSFLESQQKDFKVGGFFRSRKKTEEEKESRLNVFLNELQKTIESTIQWRLRDKLSELLRDYEIHEEQLFESVQQLIVNYTPENILQLVNPGATVNGNYILNYTNEVSADIKNRFRNQTNEFWNNIKSIVNKQNEQEIETLQHKISEHKVIVDSEEKNIELQKELNSLKTSINLVLENNDISESAKVLINEAIIKSKQFVTEAVPVQTQKEESAGTVEEEQVVEFKNQPAVEEVIQSVDEIVNTVSDLPGFKSIVEDLREKRERLNNRELTIALFGAFSAGKSSFSNALFCEQILPVSPNPTTAVINRISPVTEDYNHGTVIITLKDESTLATDVRTIMRDFNPSDGDDFHDLIAWITKEHLQDNNELNKMYQAYLHAMLDGYESQKELLGSQVTISLEQFAGFVTDETKACYVEAVDLYYDCNLTRQGITLVDTPGADSINARHTNVAFDYIKYADAILYVTYYNHAISRADRDFLMQLGRVKESFELDKMFFIVNAADLAQSESDLNLVLDYVKEQLLQFGIRFPKIFPVSSKQSLENKLDGVPLNGMMEHFEDDFYSFIHEDLAQLTIQSTVWDMNRAHKMVLNYLQTVNLGKQEQENLQLELKEKTKSIEKIVDNLNTERLEAQLKERVKRQLHYVDERLFIRFHDMFTEHFNPTTITESGQRGMAQLRKNRNEFIDYIGYELLQEIRAVSLRVESFINTLLKQFHEQADEEIRRVDQSFILASYLNAEITTPEYEQAFLDLDKEIFARALRIFRSTKSFFEQNEREKMKDAFYEILHSHIKDYIAESETQMVDEYLNQMTQLTNSMNQKIISDIKAIIDNQLAIITDTVDINVLKQKEQGVRQTINDIQ